MYLVGAVWSHQVTTVYQKGGAPVVFRDQTNRTQKSDQKIGWKQIEAWSSEMVSTPLWMELLGRTSLTAQRAVRITSRPNKTKVMEPGSVQVSVVSVHFNLFFMCCWFFFASLLFSKGWNLTTIVHLLTSDIVIAFPCQLVWLEP